MSMRFTAHSKIETVSAAMSKLVEAYPKAGPDQPCALLDEATATLSESGIEVDATRNWLHFRFDRCDGCSGAWQRIKEVQSWFPSKGVPVPQLFVSDIGLLSRDAPRRPLPDGCWEVDGDFVTFKPIYFSQYSLRPKASSEGEKYESFSIGYQLTAHISKGPCDDLGSGFRLSFSTYSRLPLPPSELDGPYTIANDRAKELGNFLGNSYELEEIENVIRKNGASAACRYLDSVMRDGLESLKDGWAENGWPVESANPIPVPDVLSSDWKVKSAAERSSRSDRLGLVGDDDGWTSIL